MFKPTHYWLGLIPCIADEPKGLTCREIEMNEEDIADYGGLDKLNSFVPIIKKYWDENNIIPIADMDKFLNTIEEKTK